jgi:3-hydroxybutyryl-CoA dehydrogenase
MRIEDVRNIAVIGSGIMGAGIAQVCALAGYRVAMRDVGEAYLQKGMEAIRSSLKKGVERGKLTQERADAAVAGIRTTLNLAEAVKEANVVIEAVPENIELKKQVFKELDELSPEDAILATNTSSFSITEIASATKRPDRVVGMHFFNPVPIMNLVEVIRGASTSDQTIQAVRGLATRLGKTPVEVNEAPGFVVNRLLAPFLNEAIFCLMEGTAEAKDIDTAIKLGLNHPMGPLELADLVGLDTTLAILDYMHEETGDPKYRPCPLLRKMVRAGHLGRKSGRGFYDYTAR